MKDFDLDDFNHKYKPNLTSELKHQIYDEEDESSGDMEQHEGCKQIADLSPQQRATLWQLGRLDVDNYNATSGQCYPDQLSEEELKERWASDWESLKKIGLSDTEALSRIKWLEELLQESMKGSTEYIPTKEITYKGPRGGKYRIVNGRKRYDIP